MFGKQFNIEFKTLQQMRPLALFW